MLSLPLQQPFGRNPLKYFLGLPGPSGFGSGSTAAAVAANWDGSGKVVLITGEDMTESRGNTQLPVQACCVHMCQWEGRAVCGRP